MGLPYSEQQPSLLGTVMKDIARSGATHRTRLPITTPLLRAMCARLDGMQLRVPHDKPLITASFFLAFHGFLRCGEPISSIKWENIKIDMARQCLEVWLKRSKTDPSGRTRALYSHMRAPCIPASYHVRTQADLCLRVAHAFMACAFASLCQTLSFSLSCRFSWNCFYLCWSLPGVEVPS